MIRGACLGSLLPALPFPLFLGIQKEKLLPFFVSLGRLRALYVLL